MVFTIENISDQVLQTILANCPIDSQKISRLVCKQWNLAVLCSLRDQKTLKLLLLPSQQTTDQQALVINQFYPTESAKRRLISINSSLLMQSFHLVKWFERVSNLELHFTRVSEDPTRLLVSWTLSLTCITFVGFPTGLTDRMRIWKQLDSLQLLRSLKLLNFSAVKLPESMPALARLDQFSLLGYRENLALVLSQLSRRLKHLSLDMVCFSTQELFQVFSSNVYFGENLCRFTLGELLEPNPTAGLKYKAFSCEKYKELLSAFSSKLSSRLTHFAILCASQFLLSDLMQSLLPFGQLFSLRLYFRSDVLDLSSVENSHLSLQPIRILNLNFNRLNPGGQLNRVISKMFPNARHLVIQCETADEVNIDAVGLDN